MPPEVTPRNIVVKQHRMPLNERYTFELTDGPLDGLRLTTRNYGLSFPTMLSFTFLVEDREDVCRVEHYSFLFQYVDPNKHTRRGGVYMHQKTVEVNVDNRKSR